MGSGSSQEVGGVRVFKVSPGSPAAEAGLEVFFDFILEVNGVKMDQGYQQAFAQKIQESQDATAKLTVFNTRAHAVREVLVRPRKWAGNGLLGATVRYDSVDPAENHGIRVLEVFVNSPAAHAGLVPYQDFLLGTAQSVFHDIDELVEVVASSINHQLQVYVYNADSETVREVPLVPNNDWGGEGCIGCDIGMGLLHRIPAPRRAPGTATEGFPPVASWAPAPVPPPGYTPQAGVPPVAAAPVVPPPVAAVPLPVAAVPPPSVPGVAVPGVPMPGIPQAAPMAPAAPGVQVPVPAAPGVHMAPPRSITGATGVPPVPTAPPGTGGTPAIRPGGAWAPAAAPAATAPVAAPQGAPPLQLPQGPPPPASGSPVPAAAKAPVPAAKGRFTWPPPARKEEDDEAEAAPVLPDFSAADPSSPTPSRTGSEYMPKAPPSTPMAAADIPSSVDLSGLDPSRFAATASAPAAVL